jgi:nitrogen fixation/metabolism regulation signal transduction histidine kinase
MGCRTVKKINHSAFLIIRLLLILFSLTGLSYVLVIQEYYASTMLLVIVVFVQAVELLKFTSKTNSELVRFLEAARYADYGQRFDFQDLGTGFGELGVAFSDILNRFQSVSTYEEKERLHLKALVEHVPVPLLSEYGDGRVTLWNHAARGLFGSESVTRVPDLARFGEKFVEQVTQLGVGERTIVLCEIDGLKQKYSLTASQVIIGGKMEKLMSLQNIQTELEAAQLQAWQDLVRVLTHEVMNSITPVISLAKTTVDLVDDVSDKIAATPELDDDMAKIRNAVQTVACRSDHLTQFIASYRQLTNLPEPDKRSIRLQKLLHGVVTLIMPAWESKDLALMTDIEPDYLEVIVDSGMVEQVLLNLLKNAEDALKNQRNAKVWLLAYRDGLGRIVVEVADNGPGVSIEISEKIFVPFYTTKRQGSGVGLALVRQIMMAHGGSIRLTPREGGGAKFTLFF